MKWRGVMCAILSNTGRNSNKDHCTTNLGTHICAAKIVYIVRDATKKETPTNLMDDQRLVLHVARSGLVNLAVRAF